MNVVPAAPAPPLAAVAPLPDVPVAVLPPAPPDMRAFASMNVLPVPAEAVAPAPLVLAPALACVPGRTQPVTITVCDWPAALRVVELCDPAVELPAPWLPEVELPEPWLPGPGLGRSDG